MPPSFILGHWIQWIYRVSLGNVHKNNEYLFCFRLLYSVLPPSVANELRHKRPVPAKRYDNVTILFSGIVGFNAFCSKHASAEGAIKIVNLLNDIYTRFDILTDSRKNPYVYKVRRPGNCVYSYLSFQFRGIAEGEKCDVWMMKIH